MASAPVGHADPWIFRGEVPAVAGDEKSTLCSGRGPDDRIGQLDPTLAADHDLLRPGRPNAALGKRQNTHRISADVECSTEGRYYAIVRSSIAFLPRLDGLRLCSGARNVLRGRSNHDLGTSRRMVVRPWIPRRGCWPYRCGGGGGERTRGKSPGTQAPLSPSLSARAFAPRTTG